uniref:Momilactone A synthase n=1 Tax=Ananas comosus var. bracteatus TaxID=296719 RepID=A0A6V7NHH6_ANACO|nr:unnamed protein product [Ananas comosus var. bracteatus]
MAAAVTAVPPPATVPTAPVAPPGEASQMSEAEHERMTERLARLCRFDPPHFDGSRIEPWVVEGWLVRKHRLEGKVAVITGGASGIGECTARLFCRHGAKVVIADIQDELGKSVCDELGPAAASFVHCDVTNEDDVSNAVDHAVAKFGKLDIMFNNAGIHTICIDFSSSESAGADPQHPEVLKIGLRARAGCERGGALPGDEARGARDDPGAARAIIATSSLAGVVSGAASHAYTCAKSAVAALTRNAAAELGRHGVRVNCVSPAARRTPLAERYVGLRGADFEAPWSPPPS